MKTHYALFSLVLAGLLALPVNLSARGKGHENAASRSEGNRSGSKAGKRQRGRRLGLRGAISKEIMDHLYPVGLVRRYAKDLNLTDNQTKKLRNIVTKVHSEVENLKWDVDRESQKLGDMVSRGASVNQVLKQMDVVFRFENSIKKKHLGLLIAIRDILTAEQKKFLDAVKESSRGKGEGPVGYRYRQRHRG